MNIDQHTVKKFDTELEGLRAQILKMGGLVEDQIAQSLNTSVSFFFEGYAENSENETVIRDDKVSIDLINSFASIKNPELKKRLLLLISSVSESNSF